MNFLQELTMAVALECQRFMASLQTHGTEERIMEKIKEKEEALRRI